MTDPGESGTVIPDKPSCPRCGIGTPIFKTSCIVCCAMPDPHAALLKEVLDHKLRAESKVTQQAQSIERLTKALEDCTDALKEMCAWHGGTHEEDCPVDDTCDCKHKSFNDRVNGAINRADAALSPKP
jgi:hypothetical protein